MSYARFSDDSDIYVYPDTGSGKLVCSDCRLSVALNPFSAGSEIEMLRHLDAHSDAGHKVPSGALARLHAEIAPRARRPDVDDLRAQLAAERERADRAERERDEARQTIEDTREALTKEGVADVDGIGRVLPPIERVRRLADRGRALDEAEGELTAALSALATERERSANLLAEVAVRTEQRDNWIARIHEADAALLRVGGFLATERAAHEATRAGGDAGDVAGLRERLGMATRFEVDGCVVWKGADSDWYVGRDAEGQCRNLTVDGRWIAPGAETTMPFGGPCQGAEVHATADAAFDALARAKVTPPNNKSAPTGEE
jgi:hypothetical protein